MKPPALRFLRRLIETPSPPGFETPLQAPVRAELAGVADEVRTDVIAVLQLLAESVGRMTPDMNLRPVGLEGTA